MLRQAPFPFLIFMLEQSQSIRHPGVGEDVVVVNRGHIDEVPVILSENGEWM